tara:strand:- start:1970 stop:2143 length:174 start_codon:yes stop_codon:yes gene_type:complete
MPDVSTGTMTKDEALLYISKLNDNQKVKITLVSNEGKKENKQLLVENSKWDYGCYKD